MNKKNSLLVLILFISSYKKNHNVANFISLKLVNKKWFIKIYFIAIDID